MSFKDLTDADPSAIDDIADGWQRLVSHLDHVEDDVKRTVGKIDNWHGEGADAALNHLDDVRTGYNDATECIEKIPGALRTLSDEISDAQRTINDVTDTIDSNNHLHIDAETVDANNAVFIGIPGVGVDHASDLQLPDDADVYASTAESDIIKRTPGFIHGQQPISDDFGAETFESSPGEDGHWYTTGKSVDAHSEYWNGDSKSLDNMSRIVNGKEPH